MRDVERQLLSCLAAYRLGKRTAKLENGFADWAGLRRLADAHKLSPIVCETLWRDPAFCGGDAELAAAWRRQTVLQAAGQAARTQRLLALVQPLEEAGVRYAVVKGALCRELYPRPDLRLSGDEDLLVDEADAVRCAERFRENGMQPVGGLPDGPVTHWLDRRTGLHVELHTALFSTRRAADRLMNGCFHEELKNTIFAPAAGGLLRAFPPTYHFLFLVCHALKHFIAGGFGIRTLCDVVTTRRTTGMPCTAGWSGWTAACFSTRFLPLGSKPWGLTRRKAAGRFALPKTRRTCSRTFWRRVFTDRAPCPAATARARYCAPPNRGAGRARCCAPRFRPRRSCTAVTRSSSAPRRCCPQSGCTGSAGMGWSCCMAGARAVRCAKVWRSAKNGSK